MFKFRKPDVVIGQNYLHRWWLIPRNKYFNVYLHKFYSSDEDRALHDHPWRSCSFLLKGEAKEHQFNKVRNLPFLTPVIRSARFAHRIEIIQGPVITLFITGPRVRHWGFHCPNNWKPWEKFTSPDGMNVGVGCGEDNDR